MLLLVGCSPLESESGFGSRLATPSCAAQAAPWILDASAMTVPASADAESALRVVTYNLHSGLGSGGALFRSRSGVARNLEGIAAAVARSPEPPDVIGLNEVDFDARRSGGFDQAHYLARALARRIGVRYDVVRGQTWERNVPGFEVRFGNAVLTRHPFTAAYICLYGGACAGARDRDDIPTLRASGLLSRMTREARGLIKLTLDFRGRSIDVIVTHLDAFVLAEREAQAAHLLHRYVDANRTTVVLGDINAVPTAMTHGRTFFAADRTHDILTSGALADARILYASGHRQSDLRQWATYPASASVWPLDAILGSLELKPHDVKVIESRYSDHHGLYVEYRVMENAAAVAEQRARHDAIRRRQLARIVGCDLVHAGVAQLRWLLGGTGFMDVASAAQRRALLQPTLP